jgi:hypothetical protein
MKKGVASKMIRNAIKKGEQERDGEDKFKTVKGSEFNKNHDDDINKAHGERIKNNVEDGENITGI